MSGDHPASVELRRELAREGGTMAIYVAVTLMAVLTALDEDRAHGDGRAFAIVWGTAAGLALAHLYAFNIAARLAARGSMERRDVQLSLGQLAGAGFVAVVVSAPIVFLPVTAQFDVARILLAAIVASAGYLVARHNGGSIVRSSMYAAATLLVAMVVALVKNILSGH